ncbi:MAG: hypothetical protein QMD10_11670 [Desulfitobacteriaceae bacterium]|nr:hypothetical protein [Desulfitobacteriaceae bacterium]
MYNYDPGRHKFSRDMSKVAFDKIYAPVLGAVNIERTDCDPGGPTDPDLRGTDVVLTLSTGRRITVAERFRHAGYIVYDDVTIRYSSLVTGRKLEIVGLNAQYMLYAVANEEEDDFLRWDLLYAARLLEVAEAFIAPLRSNVNGSSKFLAIPRRLLFKMGAIVKSSERQIA